MYSNIIRHNSKMNMLIISKGQKLVEMHQDKPNQVYEGTCIPASNLMLCIIWNAVSSYMWFCVLHSTICQISDQTLSKKMRVALHSQADNTENERGERKKHISPAPGSPSESVSWLRWWRASACWAPPAAFPVRWEHM